MLFNFIKINLSYNIVFFVLLINWFAIGIINAQPKALELEIKDKGFLDCIKK